MFEFLTKGGVLMVPLGVCSIFAVAIILERTLNLRTRKIIQFDVLQQVRDLVAGNRVSDAMTLCRRYPSVMGRVLLMAIANHNRQWGELRSIVEDAGRQEVTALDKNLGALGTIAAIAPLLGLTGTVFGMIRTFAIISEKGIAHPSQLAGGISEALITTATGLVIAIPALIFYNYFTNKAGRLLLEIEKHSYRVIETLKR